MSHIGYISVALVAAGAVLIPYLVTTKEGGNITEVSATAGSTIINGATPPTSLPAPETVAAAPVSNDGRELKQRPTGLPPGAAPLEDMIIEHQNIRLLSSKDATANPFK